MYKLVNYEDLLTYIPFQIPTAKIIIGGTFILFQVLYRQLLGLGIDLIFK